MKTTYFLFQFPVLITIFLFSVGASAQDTFSICAIDSATGQVGSAGATCIASSATSAIIISAVHPGVGAIHTQAYWLAANQNYANTLMNMGTLSPQQIIDSLVAHDAQNNPYIRQYGVVDLVGGGRSAAYTGVNCNDYKNHITGPNYSIQGNILLGQQILDSMQSRFVNTTGTLACKLMAALQGAKVIGADTRCNQYGISSFSSFIRVANTTDVAGSFYLDITVNTFPTSVDPIDSLQVLFDAWGGCSPLYVPSITGDQGITIFPNPASDKITITANQFYGSVELLNPFGSVIESVEATDKHEITFNVSQLAKGIYFLKMKNKNGIAYTSTFTKQ